VRLQSVLAVIFVVIAGTALRANLVSSLDINDHALIINVPIDVVGAETALVLRWWRAIDRVWNRGNDGRPYTVCGRTVEFNPTFTLLDSAEPSRTSHLVIVRQINAGEQYVSSVWHALGTSPAYSPRTGYWGSNMDGATAAHEFGHLLGLLDEYVERDFNRNGLREPSERPAPDIDRYPDGWFSLMAREHGSVLDRHVRDVIRMHGGEDLLTCAAER
jgi:hypothetical protein